MVLLNVVIMPAVVSYYVIFIHPVRKRINDSCDLAMALAWDDLAKNHGGAPLPKKMAKLLAPLEGLRTGSRLSRPAWKFEVAVPRLRPARW